MPGRAFREQMSPPEEIAGATDADAVPERAIVGGYATESTGFDHGLVVLAMGLPFWLEPVDGQFRLLVEPAHAAVVREELECFDRENANWPPRPASPAEAPRAVAVGLPLLWAVVVLLVFRAQCEWPGALEQSGAVDAGAVLHQGEWWRLASALFLHADVAHLVANVLFGMPVFSAVLTTLGRLRGVLLVAGTAVAGNLAAVVLQSAGPYRSLGASTAVFAGLGLLTGHAVRAARRSDGAHRWRAIVVPLGSGVALLGLMGTGGLRTDVVAHAAGFVAGFLGGLITPIRVAESPRNPRELEQAKMENTGN
jgi:rhomboid protease GluP